MRLLNPLAGVLLSIAAGACLAGETYRWVDERGVTNYGEKPPANRRATPVDTQTGGVIETAQPGSAPEAERRRAADEQFRPPQQPLMAAVPSAAAVRGMDFDVYIRLQRGMTEGELLLRAGRPDHESLDGFGYGVVKTYYYFPTLSNPFTTVVSLRSGRIHELDRIKKF
jgi:hypothetical protein